MLVGPSVLIDLGRYRDLTGALFFACYGVMVVELVVG